MASAWSNPFLRNALQAKLTDGSPTLKLLILNGGATVDKTDEFVSDVLAANTEISGTGYSRKTLANSAVTVVDEGGGVYRIKFDADDVIFTNIDAGTIGIGVIFIDNGTDATNEVVIWSDPADQVTDGSTIEFRFDANGIGRLNN